MAADRGELAYEVTWLIRRTFRAMGSAAEDYLAGSGITAAERAVLEFLFPGQRYSVPDIARRYDVSRQHIQVTVNGLVERGLLRREDNPQHKRSPLIRLSRSGRETFAAIRREETAFIDAVFAGVDVGDLATTRRTLKRLFDNLK